MKYSEKKLLGIELFIILLFLVNIFFLQANIYVISLVLIVTFFISVLILGFEDDRHRFKKDGVLLSIIFAIVYEILIYLFGLYVGFLRSSYSLSLLGFAQNIIPFLLITIVSEILRFEFITKGEKKSIFPIITFMLFVLIDTSVNMYNYDLNNQREIVEMICLVFIPSISKNILLTYWMEKFGILANVIYLGITTLIVFLVPIIPDFNKYLQAVIGVIYPIMLYLITRRILKDYNKEKEYKNIKAKRITTIALAAFILVIVALSSGIFKYRFLTIGSGSMRNELYVGDVIIVKKLDKDEFKEIEVGTILVFKKENKIVVHRVVEIDDSGDFVIYYTKGDYNKDRDNWVVTERDIIGSTRYKIPLVGLPSIWLKDFVERRH